MICTNPQGAHRVLYNMIGTMMQEYRATDDNTYTILAGTTSQHIITQPSAVIGISANTYTCCPFIAPALTFGVAC